MKLFAMGIALSIAAALAGCAAETPNADAAFGDSVRQMVQAQTNDPAASQNPPAQAPDVGDGQRLEGVIDNYRKDVAKGTSEVQQDIVINVGE